MKHICEGGLKAQLYRTAQGKRSGALGSHSIPAPTFAPCKSRKHWEKNGA